MLSVPLCASTAVERLNWLRSSQAGPVLHIQRALKFTIHLYITYMCVVTLVMRRGLMVCPASQEQSKILGHALEKVQFSSP